MTIRNLPDDVYAALKERAKGNRRSLNQEVITELVASQNAPEKERAIAARARWEQANEQIDAMRARKPRFFTTEEIDEATREGRR